MAVKILRECAPGDISPEQSKRHVTGPRKHVIVVCLALALLAALSYSLMGAGVIRVGGLSPQDAPPVMAYLAGAGYVAGGLLLGSKMRWLWAVGLMINTLVIAIFFAAYYQKPEVIFSLGGMASKTVEIMLEAGLIYLVATHRRTRLARQE